MKIIDTTKWKEFLIGNIFIIERGKRLISIDQVQGEIAYISSTKERNGIDNFISTPNFMKTYKNVITINNSGSVGYCFYHNYEINVSDHCTVIKIKNKEMNIYIGMFLIPILQSFKKKYNFGREINNERLKKEIIKLPYKKNEPDWDYMENYVKELSSKIKYDKEIIKNKNKINTINFKEFTLKDLFEVKGSGGNATQFEVSEGEYLYVTTSNKNNGVSGTSNIYTQEGNVITIDSATNGKAFYQENNFIGSDHVEVIIPKDFILNKYTGLFFVTILNKECFRYNYGRKRNQTRIKNQKLFLPVKQNNEIDFDYMENYIKSLPYSSKI